MRDEARSAAHEKKIQRQKQQEQYEMLQEQEENVLYPRNEDMRILQKQLEDQYFADLAKKAK